MIPPLAALRFDVVVQARSGFYWATGFLILVVGGLLRALPAGARADAAAWVPALLVANLQITTFFFAAGLMLLERDEGTLAALAVSPYTAAAYLVTRVLTLTLLAAVESFAVVWVAFGMGASWIPIVAGTGLLGGLYTCLGAAVAARFDSVNSLLLPASAFVSLLLLPLLAHFGLAPRALFLLHPVEPSLTLMRAGYQGLDSRELAYGVLGSLAWASLAFAWARRSVGRLMREGRSRTGQ
jgi:fluoroquinolone transport system permease protein